VETPPHFESYGDWTDDWFFVYYKHDTLAASCGGTRSADSVRSASLVRGSLVTHPFFGELPLVAGAGISVTPPARERGSLVSRRSGKQAGYLLAAAGFAITSVDFVLYTAPLEEPL
jgi:hypothetical protein